MANIKSIYDNNIIPSPFEIFKSDLRTGQIDDYGEFTYTGTTASYPQWCYISAVAPILGLICSSITYNNDEYYCYDLVSLEQVDIKTNEENIIYLQKSSDNSDNKVFIMPKDISWSQLICSIIKNNLID